MIERTPLVRLSAKRAEPRNRTLLMAILNVTDDSFSGDGTLDVDGIAARAVHAMAAGADLLDVGAESTRPGAAPVSAEEEARRLLPAVRAIRARLPDVVISIDTYKAEIFSAAREAGADMLNVVRAFDDALLDATASCGAPVVIAHPGCDHDRVDGVVDEVLAYLESDAKRALDRGIAAERIILDYGIGFGKTAEQNVALLGALDRLSALGFPTLLGASRKSTLGRLTGRDVEERVFATAATTALAAVARIDLVRVHDVAAMRDVVRVCDAVVRQGDR